MKEDILESRINRLHGEMMAQRLAMELVLINFPDALNALRSINLDHYEGLSFFRSLPDEAIQSAKDHLALLQQAGSV